MGERLVTNGSRKVCEIKYCCAKVFLLTAARIEAHFTLSTLLQTGSFNKPLRLSFSLLPIRQRKKLSSVGSLMCLAKLRGRPKMPIVLCE